jgi:hypothetical protein
MPCEGKFMLKITEEGRAKVASPEFAEEIRQFVLVSKCAGMKEGATEDEIEGRVALALSGTEDRFRIAFTEEDEFGVALEPKDYDDIKWFTDEHKTEINEVIKKIAETIKIRLVASLPAKTY